MIRGTTKKYNKSIREFVEDNIYSLEELGFSYKEDCDIHSFSKKIYLDNRYNKSGKYDLIVNIFDEPFSDITKIDIVCKYFPDKMGLIFHSITSENHRFDLVIDFYLSFILLYEEIFRDRNINLEPIRFPFYYADSFDVAFDSFFDAKFRLDQNIEEYCISNVFELYPRYRTINPRIENMSFMLKDEKYYFNEWIQKRPIRSNLMNH